MRYLYLPAPLVYHERMRPGCYVREAFYIDMRDDFVRQVKDTLARRAGMRYFLEILDLMVDQVATAP